MLYFGAVREPGALGTSLLRNRFLVHEPTLVRVSITVALELLPNSASSLPNQVRETGLRAPFRPGFSWMCC